MRGCKAAASSIDPAPARSVQDLRAAVREMVLHVLHLQLDSSVARRCLHRLAQDRGAAVGRERDALPEHAEGRRRDRRAAGRASRGVTRARPRSAHLRLARSSIPGSRAALPRIGSPGCRGATSEASRSKILPRMRLVIRGGQVLAGDPGDGRFEHADVVVEDGRIAEIGPSGGISEAQVVDAAGMLVLPGFVDTHRHTWQTAMRGICADWTLLDYFRGIRLQISSAFGPEDVYAGNYVGALEALDSGVTTLLDFSHCMNSPEHADEAVRGLTDAGVRGDLRLRDVPRAAGAAGLRHARGPARRRAPRARALLLLGRRAARHGGRPHRAGPRALRRHARRGGAGP